MAVQAKLEEAIHAVAPEARIELEVISGRLSGTVIAEEFDDWSHLERQRKIWESIRASMGTEATQVGMLLLYSPEEADAVDDSVED
jgi:acid stress-induced BolA-like protein IbaG/YrbA